MDRILDKKPQRKQTNKTTEAQQTKIKLCNILLMNLQAHADL